MERWQKLVIACLTVVAIALAGFSLGLAVAGGEGSGDELGSGSGSSVVGAAYDKIKQLSADPPSDRELTRGAIKGMTRVLRASGDDYALYYTPRAYEDFQEITTGQFSGIGVWLKQRAGRLEVVSVLPNTPALRAGMRSGDVIESIEGEPVGNLNSDEAVTRIKGKKGTEVDLMVVRDGQTLSFSITRETIELPNLLSNQNGDLGYIRLFGFAKGAGRQVRQEVTKLRDEGANGLILDLRDNGGGLFSEGISVASVFIERGEIVSYKEHALPAATYSARGEAFEGIPLVVLVNEGTASASEIVTGALQDTERAVVVGTRTYGKGSVQKVLPLNDSSALKLTIGSYFTPGGRKINGRGIEPDIEVEGDPQTQRQRAVQILQGIVISSSGSQG